MVTLDDAICTTGDDLTSVICESMVTSNCALYTAWGTRITSCADISSGDSVFVVPDKRMFIFPTRGAATTMDIIHLGQPSFAPIMLETLSEYPRIFRLHNFFNEYEADALIADAVEEYQSNPPPPRPRRPSYLTTETDTEMEINANEFMASMQNGMEHPLEAMTGDRIDLSKDATMLKSDVALRLRRRVLDLLGVFPYDGTYAEGWQVLRYNASQGYDIHQDWIEPSFLASHDYNSAYEGTNRFIAVYLYLKTPMEGGETVFPLLDPTSQQVREQFFKQEVLQYREKARKLKQDFLDRQQLDLLLNRYSANDDTDASVDDDDEANEVEIDRKSTEAKAKQQRRLICRFPKGTAEEDIASFNPVAALKKNKSKKRKAANSGSNNKNKNKSKAKKPKTKKTQKKKSSKSRTRTASAFDDMAILEEVTMVNDEEVEDEGDGDGEVEPRVCEEVIIDEFGMLVATEDVLRRFHEDSNDWVWMAVDIPPALPDPTMSPAERKFRDSISDPMLQRAYDDLSALPYFAPTSWEYSVHEQCRKRFTVRPQRLEALVFYVQKPNGLPDTQALHASCPIVQGEKMIAAMWVWNGPKAGSWTRNVDTGRYEKPPVLAVSASFEVLDLLYAKLYWEDQVWEELSPGRPVKVNTYAGQTWRILIGEQVVASWVMATDQPRQRYTVSSADIPTQYVDYRGP